MSGFKPVELFGGAITADFPAAFGDVRYVYSPYRPIAKDELSQRPQTLERALQRNISKASNKHSEAISVDLNLYLREKTLVSD
jgi:D-alanyl-D-alanine dipeptidase